MQKCNLRTVRNHVAKHEAFNCNGTLTGDWTYRKPLTGQMNDSEIIKTFDSMFHEGIDTFVIKSYSTPIAAWNKVFGWWVSPLKHSVTTSRHQSAVRAGIN